MDPRSAISQNIDIISIISNFQKCSALVSDFGTDTHTHTYIYIYSVWTEKNNQRPEISNYAHTLSVNLGTKHGTFFCEGHFLLAVAHVIQFVFIAIAVKGFIFIECPKTENSPLPRQPHKNLAFSAANICIVE